MRKYVPTHFLLNAIVCINSSNELNLVKSMKTKTKATNFDVLLGLRIKELRLSYNMTQQDLADTLGITFQQIQKYENGRNRIPVSSLLKISEKLDVDIVKLLNVEKPLEPDDINAEMRTLYKNFSSIKSLPVKKCLQELILSLSRQ